jgi:hypothetical protein
VATFCRFLEHSLCWLGVDLNRSESGCFIAENLYGDVDSAGVDGPVAAGFSQRREYRVMSSTPFTPERFWPDRVGHRPGDID